jgi:hypothetical protein
VSETELAWAAGFYDGEGCTFAKRTGRHWYLNMMVAQNDRRPLDRFVAAIGVGRVRGPIQHTSPRSHEFYRVDLGSVASWKAINLLWPYLSEPKREQILEKVGTVEARRASN